MSYDIKIYTIHKQDYNDLTDKFNIVFNKRGFVLSLKENQIVVSEELKLEDEDIPKHISKVLPGINYLIECSLESIVYEQESVKDLLKLGKAIAKNGIGVIEDPQINEIILPEGIKRVLPIEKTERLAIIELSWWFNTMPEKERIYRLLEVIEKNLPEALPRRYGLYHPPKEKYKTLDEFAKFIEENINNTIVWYPASPVVSVHFSIPPQIGSTRLGYRFGHFSISVDSAVLPMYGWEGAIIRLFKNISEVLCPFYGDIYLLNDYIRSKTSLLTDEKTQRHPIKSWWWNGIPKKPGIAMVIGEPILQYVRISREVISLNNGCKLLIKNKDDENDTVYKGVHIQKGLYQPKSKLLDILNIIAYPRIWPFEGPKVR